MMKCHTSHQQSKEQHVRRPDNDTANKERSLSSSVFAPDYHNNVVVMLVPCLNMLFVLKGVVIENENMSENKRLECLRIERKL